MEGEQGGWEGVCRIWSFFWNQGVLQEVFLTWNQSHGECRMTCFQVLNGSVLDLVEEGGTEVAVSEVLSFSLVQSVIALFE